MELSRRRFLTAAAACAAIPPTGSYADRPTRTPTSRHRLHQRIETPARIVKIEVLRRNNSYYVRVRSADEAVGIVAANQGRVLDLLSLFQRRVAPFFLDKDARKIETLVDDVYVVNSNYKFAGMPFWNCVSHIEFALLDLLARRQQLSVAQLLGGVLREEIPVYVSRFERYTSAQEAADKAVAAVEQAGAEAVKLKIGLRMQNSAEQTRRDRELVKLARRRLGDKVAVLVDANGSYTVQEAIEMGRYLKEHRVGFFEEPCPWQEYEDTKRVADALEITVAGGEQDSSLARWDWMTRNRCVDLVQPDMFYNGGLIRALRVAKMAEQAGLFVTPHSPKTGEEAYPNLQFCAIVRNLGPFQEYRESPEIKNGKVALPAGQGMGIAYDENEWTGAEIIWSRSS